MRGITRKVLLPILGSHVVGVLVIFFSLLVWGDKSILPDFVWSWIIQSVIVTWIDYYIPLTVTGIILGFSVFINTVELRSLLQGQSSFVRIAGKTVVLVLLFAVVFVVLTGLEYGSARQQRDTLVAKSQKARSLVLDAKEKADRGQVTEAIGMTKLALQIAPGYLAATELQDKLAEDRTESGAHPEVADGGVNGGHSEGTAGREGEANSSEAEGEKHIPPMSKEQGLIYADNLKLAREYLDRGDDYSALYFIRKAEETSARTDPVLTDLKTEAEKNIRGNGKTIEDTKKRQIHEAKQRAILVYLENARPIEAYYQLLEVEAMARGESDLRTGSVKVGADLAKILEAIPDYGTSTGRMNESGERRLVLVGKGFSDSDFCRWMPEVLAALEHDTFYREEAEDLLSGASGAGLMFLNREEGGIREYVYAQAVLQGRFNLYLVSPEIIAIADDGRVQSHRIAAYGKVVGTSLIMKSISHTAAESIEEVRVLEGKVDPDTRNLLRLHQSPETMWNLAQSRFGYQDMSFPELLGLLPVVAKAGYDILPLHSVLLGYFLQVLSFPSLCFFAMGWGWSNRNRYLTRPVLLTLLMVVAVPALMIILLKMYQYLGSCLNSSLLILGGFETALMILVIVQVVQLTVSLIYVAGQSVD